MARKYKQGFYKLINPQKYVGNTNQVVYRSSWERILNNWLDMNPSVIQWNSEQLVIPYYSEFDQKNRRYFVDYVAKMRLSNGEIKTFIIQVKPDAQTRQPKRKKGQRQETYLNEMATWMVNRDKWTAAKAFAQKNGMDFIIITEYELGLKKRD